MIIWINGAFGAGKTTLAELLDQKLANARIFDPEDIGYIIQKRFPETRQLDYQDLPMWRNLVIQFMAEAHTQFGTALIVPMTLVVPEYINEIFAGIRNNNLALYHFFLETDKEELVDRITKQILIANNQERDEEVRQWRLAQIDRCYASVKNMPGETIRLNSNANSPEQLSMLVEECLAKG